MEMGFVFRIPVAMAIESQTEEPESLHFQMRSEANRLLG